MVKKSTLHARKTNKKVAHKKARTLKDKRSLSFKELFTKTPRPVAIMVGFAVVGTVLLAISQAATIISSFEAEDGDRTNGVSILADGNSSDGAHIRFGPPQTYQDIFVSTAGNDNNNGTSQATPYKTIAKAVTEASGNTRIRLMAGDYIETVRIEKDNLVIEPFGNGNVNIIGAIPEYINGVTWTYISPGIYKHNLGRPENQPDGNAIYDRTGNQWWSYPTVFTLASRFTVNQLPGVFIMGNEVYVASDTNQAPIAPLYIGANRATLDIINSNNITIKGVTNSELKISYGSNNIRVRTSNNVTVDDVTVIGGKTGISAFDSSNITITNNVVDGDFDRSWDYSDVKDGPDTKTMEGSAVLVRASYADINNITVDNNKISGYWAGVHFPTLYKRGTNTKFYNDNSVISNNEIHDLSGPGIEPEAPFRNLVIKGNRVYDSHTPFSPTPVIEGPVYVYENLFVAERTITTLYGAQTVGPSFAVKIHSNSLEPPHNLHFYHNTVYQAGNTSDYRKSLETQPDEITRDMTFTNNIIYSTGGGIMRGSGRAVDGIEWDGNVFHSDTTSPNRYYAWNSFYGDGNSFASLSAIIAGGALPSQWQGNAEGNPNFNCVTSSNPSCFRPSASITKPSNLQPIPSGFAESSRLNNRTRIGAYE